MRILRILLLLIAATIIFTVGCTNNTNYTSYSPEDISVVNKHGEGTLPLSYWLDSSISPEFSKVAGDIMGAYFFVTNLELLDDPNDFWQTPQETLNLGGGDCEDLSFLFVSLLQSRNIESTIVVGSFDGDGHMWVEVNNRVCETTSFTLPFGIDESTQLGYIPKIKVLVR